MEDNISFVEGCYRLPEDDWKVFIFIRERHGECIEPEWRESAWDSGVRGILIYYPPDRILGKQAVEAVLSEALGVTDWIEVRGPDSMQLR